MTDEENMCHSEPAGRNIPAPATEYSIEPGCAAPLGKTRRQRAAEGPDLP
jgi:hypothetical protein